MIIGTENQFLVFFLSSGLRQVCITKWNISVIPIKTYEMFLLSIQNICFERDVSFTQPKQILSLGNYKKLFIKNPYPLSNVFQILLKLGNFKLLSFFCICQFIAFHTSSNCDFFCKYWENSGLTLPLALCY